jgi:hypothetical protein
LHKFIISRDNRPDGDIIDVLEVYSSIGIWSIFPDNWCGAGVVVRPYDKVLFYLWVVIYILGYHDYGTAFHVPIKEALQYMTEGLRVCAMHGDSEDLRPIKKRASIVDESDCDVEI